MLSLALYLLLPLQPMNAETAQRAVEPIRDAVVHLSHRKDGKEVGNGTGFVIRKNGLIVTNHHVIEMGDLIARFRDGSEKHVLGIIADAPEYDLALIKVEAKELTTIPFAAEVKTGESVALVGSPFGLEQTLGVGIVSAIRPNGFPESFNRNPMREKIIGPIVQHTISTSSGSSGSPILNMSGELVAVNHSEMRASEVNFAAHVSVLKKLIKKTDLNVAPKGMYPQRTRNLIISASVGVVLILVLGLATWIGRRKAKLERVTRKKGKYHLH